MADFVVREATEADFDQWFEVFEAVAAEAKWVGSEAPMDRDRRRAGYLETLVRNDATTFVVEGDGTVVGALGIHGGSPGLYDLGMFLAPEWRGRGAGSALMECCLAWAREHAAHKITLTLWPHNVAARALYEKFGFTVEGRFRRHYRRKSGELWDAVAMGLVLDDESPGSAH
ncbi:MAG TPA: GNAT family protein [Acidimicrobiales bacterium]|nr:GNAT family protein [Acidimicrobiales bacterium]